MSYCRFSDESDVYVFVNIQNKWECCRCAFRSAPGHAESKIVDTVQEMISHLGEHKKFGHKVPEEVIGKLRCERDRCGSGGSN